MGIGDYLTKGGQQHDPEALQEALWLEMRHGWGADGVARTRAYWSQRRGSRVTYAWWRRVGRQVRALQAARRAELKRQYLAALFG